MREYSITYKDLFCYIVQLKVRLDTNVGHLFERQYFDKLTWPNATMGDINQYSSDFVCKPSM